MKETVFFNRRKGSDRRIDFDPCSDMELDMYHRKRRRSIDRRNRVRTLVEDYTAYASPPISSSESTRH